ncbi:MAG: PAS domain S-box protein, partial [Planctomycetia bacterium]
MGQLSTLLQNHRDVILRMMSERRSGQDGNELIESHQADLFAALLAAGEKRDTTNLTWTKRAIEKVTDGLALEIPMAALAVLERTVRQVVIRLAENRTRLVDVLDELAESTERLRVTVAQAVQDDEFVSFDQILGQLALRCNDIVCLTSLSGKPLYLNQLGRRFVGADEGGDLQIQSLHDYHEEISWQELQEVAVPAVKKTGIWNGLSRLLSPITGETAEVDTTMSLIRDPVDNGPICLAVVHRSLGKAAKLERQLAETQERKNSILETSLDPIITINHDGLITEFNRAAEQTFGRKRTEVLGTRPSEILFPPSMTTGHQNRIDRYLNAGEGSMLSKRTEVVAVRADGRPFEAELTMAISQEQGAPVLTFFVRDISDRKRAEEEERRYARDLERSNRELEQFAYVASHDLQEPLRKIRTFGDRLQRNCEESLDDVGRDCLSRMQSAAGRMQELINGLLNLSRITTKTAEYVSVDLGQVTREVVSDLEVKIEQSGAMIEVGKMPTIQADPVQLRQLLQNLIGNALKFHEEGSTPIVKIEARYTVNRTERATAGHANSDINEEMCRITVEDNGIGFDEKYLDRIFKVFQRLHPRDVHEGTG